MTKKIFLYCLLVGAATLLLCAGLFFGLQYRQILDDSYATLKQESHYVSKGIAKNGAAYLNVLDSDRQITWMDENGNIIGENELNAGKGNIKKMATGEQIEVPLTAEDIAETIGGSQNE